MSMRIAKLSDCADALDGFAIYIKFYVKFHLKIDNRKLRILCRRCWWQFRRRKKEQSSITRTT